MDLAVGSFSSVQIQKLSEFPFAERSLSRAFGCALPAVGLGSMHAAGGKR